MSYIKKIVNLSTSYPQFFECYEFSELMLLQKG